MVKQKVYHPTTRLQEVYHSQKDQKPTNDYSLTQDEELELVVAVKPYNPIESHDAISVDMKIKVCDYSYKSQYDLEVTDSLLVDANQYDNYWVRLINKKNNQKYTAKCVNFEDYEDQAFKELLQEIYIV